MWPHMLFGPYQCVYGALFRIRLSYDGDDGEYTKTCWNCFNVNFNVNFKTVFKTIQLCISW